MMDSHIDVVPIYKNDLPECVRLHKDVFKIKRGVSLGIKVVNWEFCDNPKGQGIGYCAKYNNKIIGFYVTIPVKLSVFGEELIFFEVVGSALHPAFRGKNIFQILAKKSIKTFSAFSNKTVGTGFPNQAAFKIGKRALAYHKILNIRRYLKPLTLYALVYNPKQNFVFRFILPVFSFLITPFLGLNRWIFKDTHFKFNLKRLDDIPSDYEGFWQEACKKYEIIPVCDREYLRWRFFNEPGVKNEFYEARLEGKLIGYFVLNFHGHIADIVDFFCVRKDKITYSLFYSMMQFINKRKPWWVRFRIKDDYIEKLLADEKFTVDDMTIFVLNDDAPAGKDFINQILMADKWYLTDNLFKLG